MASAPFGAPAAPETPWWAGWARTRPRRRCLRAPPCPPESRPDSPLPLTFPRRPAARAHGEPASLKQARKASGDAPSSRWGQGAGLQSDSEHVCTEQAGMPQGSETSNAVPLHHPRHNHTPTWSPASYRDVPDSKLEPGAWLCAEESKTEPQVRGLRGAPVRGGSRPCSWRRR